MKKEKITIKVLIENDRIYVDDYNAYTTPHL